MRPVHPARGRDKILGAGRDVLVNDEVEKCFDSVHTIVKAERLRRSRQTGLIGFIRGLNK